MRHSIQIMKESMRYRKTITHPHLICVRRRLVYVSDWGKYSVSVFSSKGNFVASFGHKGMEAGQFSCPSGLAVDEDNAIYSG